MKGIVVAILFFVVASVSHAQPVVGVEGGVGRNLRYSSLNTFTLKGYVVSRITRRVYVGGQMSVERYSFQYNSKISPATVQYGDLVSVKNRSSYLFFSPMLDVGFGEHKYIHARLTPGYGLFLGGNQWTEKYQPYWTTPTGPYGQDTAAHNTSYNLKTFMPRVGLALSERIPTHGYFNVVITEEFAFLPRKFYDAPKLRNDYFSITVGVSHNYRRILVEY